MQANIFCRYFCDVVKSLKTKAIPFTDFAWRKLRHVPTRTKKVFRLTYVSRIFVEKELKILKRKKATGLDNLPSSLLKDCAISLSKPLSFIINLSITTGKVPNVWKMAKIVPIHKSGATGKPENYRPISVLPILSKILEKAVHCQLMQFLEENHLLSDSQFGYRPKRSTKMAATLFTDHIRRELDQGKLVGAIFIDLTKAFDTISHSVLINKLSSYGIHGQELNWFTDYLFQRKQQVDLESVHSDEAPIFNGVPQGSILGPLLFILFLNDLPEQLKHSRIIKYADDTVIYLSDKDVVIIENELIEDLSRISTYFNENELIINLKKGKKEAMLFGTTKRLSGVTKQFTVTYQDKIVNYVEKYKYLGNIIDKNLTLQSNFKASYKKASGRLMLLSKLRSYLNVEAAKKVYMIMIVPLLTYSGTIHLNFTKTQQDKLKSIGRRGKLIISMNTEIPDIYQCIKKETCKAVRICLDGKSCENFQNYFDLQKCEIRTRNVGCMVKLPRVKLNVARNSFYFYGAKLYNELPIDIRRCKNFDFFSNLLRKHFA